LLNEQAPVAATLLIHIGIQRRKVLWDLSPLNASKDKKQEEDHAFVVAVLKQFVKREKQA
jgi:hypothetical protein